MEYGIKWDFEGVNLRSFLEKAKNPDSGCSEGDVISFILNVKIFMMPPQTYPYRM